MTNKIYALVGPHASGKTMLLGQFISLGLNYIPTYTTREPGKIDSDSTFYRFVSKEEFFKLELIVKVTYKGQYYGVLKDDVLNALKNHQVSLMLSDNNGMKQISRILKERFESIYIMSDYVTLVERMLLLGHTNDEIKYHLEYAENNGEFDYWKLTNYVVKNVHDPKITFEQVAAILGLVNVKPKEEISDI